MSGHPSRYTAIGFSDNARRVGRIKQPGGGKEPKRLSLPCTFTCLPISFMAL